ncbi:hypothetical protein AS589_09190 [Empedobacter brevis]|uniref:hypothetical protein n=1 Tax=Empedobacter brevis TaxID=247 RepID=UPI0013203AD7|nr:hypothetical protein [Empedobacter brevis]QHC84930.1 hypothetical protein AS589_09190 [Empedobacter brevis]
MKYIHLVFSLFTLITYAQNKSKVDKIDTLDVKSLNNLDFKNNLKNKVLVKTLLLEDGNTINYKDTLTVGLPSDGSNTQRTNTSAFVYNTKSQTNYTYLFGNRYSVGGDLFLGKIGLPTNSMTGEKIILKDIVIYKSGKSTTITSNFTRLDGEKVYSGPYGHIIDVDKAYLQGEFYLSKRILTRQEAILKLKEAKDLVDLEMMSKEDFENLKKELEPIIKTNN